jgi:cyanophycinase-like exopeptidase
MHFRQRKREPRLRGVLDKNPGLLGIGIDEATALIVRGHQSEVMGQGQVHFFDRNKPVAEGQPADASVQTGGRYDW